MTNTPSKNQPGDLEHRTVHDRLGKKRPAQHNDWMDDVTPQALISTIQLNVRGRRRELHMTQVQLATKAGLPQSVISRVENGNLAISLESLAKIATALNTTPALLLTDGAYSEIPQTVA